MFKLKQDREAWISVTMPDNFGKAVIGLKVKIITFSEDAAKKHDNFQKILESMRAEVDSGAIDSVASLMAKLSGLVTLNSEESVKNAIDLIAVRVTDWKDVADEDGKQVPFEIDLFRDFLNYSRAIVKKINAALESFDEDGRVKN